MECIKCDKPMVKKQSNITFNRPGIGEYKIPGVLHYACDKCSAKIVPPVEVRRIEEVGLKIHLFIVLNRDGPDSILNLKEKLNCGDDELFELLIKLEKEGQVKLSDDGRFPFVGLIDDPSVVKYESKTWIGKLLSKFFK